MALINIMLNLVLIPKFQVIGAALSTFLSLTIYNLIKLAYIYIRFKIQPFSWATLSVLALGALGFGLSLLIPDTGNHILNILLKSGLIGVAYIVCIIKWRVSEDVNELWADALKKIGIKS
jgi:O-antigen/teichoic acid export membrane protein